MTSTKEFIDHLFIKYYNSLIAYARSNLQDMYYAEDVVQDTFYEALRKADELMIHPNVGGWLTETLKNKIRNLKKKLARLSKHVVSYEAQWDQIELIPVLDNPSGYIMYVCHVAKDVLTPKDYLLFRRIAIEQVSYADAAKELGISTDAAYKRMERVRKKIRNMF